LHVSVDTNGVAFEFEFNVDVPHWCNPTVRAYGTFKLGADLGGISIQWVNPAQGSLDWHGCDALEEIPILGLGVLVAYDVLGVQDETNSSVQSAVEDAVKTSLPDASDSALFLHGSASHTNEVRVNLRFPVSSIGIEVPYDAFDMNRTGTLFGRGEVISVFASGSGMNDTVAQLTPQTTLWSGPNGVPRYPGGLSWPNELTVARSGTLQCNAMPVGRLLARTSSHQQPHHLCLHPRMCPHGARGTLLLTGVALRSQ
jgi:hypothetical protein